VVMFLSSAFFDMVAYLFRNRMIKYQEISCDGYLKRRVPIKYVTLIKDMYINVVTSVRVCDGEFNAFRHFPLR
jgi:hypothetical protein